MKKNLTRDTKPSRDNLLVLRFSAMGDVALTLPVVRGVLNDHPDLHITIVTRDFFAPFFWNIDRLEIFAADFTERHKGLAGIFRLFRDLQKLHNYSCIIDLHDVLRSQLLSLLFQLRGKEVFKINKERKLKRSYLHRNAPPDLKHSIDRYAEVMEKAGLKVAPMRPPVFILSTSIEKELEEFMQGLPGNGKLIGIAPFAKHRLKVWPLKRVRNFIEKLSAYSGIQILLFGGGTYEKEQLKLLSDRYSRSKVVNLSLNAEIALISKLDCMISMDSANMHIAALSGIPVISIWGATHPGMGFSAWNQESENSIQISVGELSCRPCSIYGKGICHRGDFACMERISSDQVIAKLVQLKMI